MVLAEYFGTTRNFTILATDLCTQALRTARQAVYPNELGKPIPFALRQKYTLTGRGSQAGRFRIVPELRERVTFEHVNLIADDWQVPGVMHVIFCRNVMIYFDIKDRRRDRRRFRRNLKAWRLSVHRPFRDPGWHRPRPGLRPGQADHLCLQTIAGNMMKARSGFSSWMTWPSCGRPCREILQSDPEIAVMGVAADPYIAAEKMAIRDSRRHHAGYRNAAHGRPDLPRKDHVPASDSGGDVLQPRPTRAAPPRCAPWNAAPSASSPSRRWARRPSWKNRGSPSATRSRPPPASSRAG